MVYLDAQKTTHGGMPTQKSTTLGQCGVTRTEAQALSFEVKISISPLVTPQGLSLKSSPFYTQPRDP